MTTTAHPASEAPAIDARKRRKDLVAVNIGNALEWFDWNIYAIFAPFFAAQFFSSTDTLSALLSTLAIFAVGFLMRPIGGWVFGRIADRRGRRFSLTLAIALAAIGSLIIAVSPTFAQIGVLASAVLLLARLVQGLSHGGETGSAFTYLAEVAPERRRGLWASTPWVGVAIGSMAATGLGAALTAILSDTAMAEYGWRIPFAIGALLGVYALYIRFRMDESAHYEASAAEEERPTLRATFSELWAERRGALQIVGLTISGVVAFYTWIIFAPGYASRAYGMDPTVALVIGVIAQAIFLVACLAWGRYSDAVGRRPVLFVFSIGFLIAAIPLELLLGGSPWTLMLTMGVAAILMAANCAPLGAVFAELVPTRQRATLIGIAYATSAAIFGGTAPYLNTWLSSLGLHLGFAAYIMVLCAITTAVLIFMPETRGRALR
ncbi:MFS transporter [Salinibacterium sp. SYSU T00001]|uniref:MFS transporter n=1 Tax=Homoserinimonas sedimenticola TaxID=2986805 RepID=UPI002235AAED|nr:MFS transporter [Salinibacterium sedimenticola]MCW4384374.1 MFS transporter [Salinibacterium sedimenticola]